MSTDVPAPPVGRRRQALLLMLPVALIAFGVPHALHLGAHAQAVVAVAVLGAAAFAAAAIERVHVGTAMPEPANDAATTAAPAVDPGLPERMERQRVELETLARRLMTVQEDERASLSRELHDDVGQAITAIKLCASSLLHEPDPPRRAVVLETAHEIAAIADTTVAKLRDLSLLLRPPQLDALGLEAALRWQAGALFRADYPRLALQVAHLHCRPPHDVELACFRIAQEALTNVLRHARAGRVVLSLDCDETELRLAIEDDGCGIAADHRAGLGLITMRERARQVGGRLEVDSRPGCTRIAATLPLPAEDELRPGVPRG